MLLINQLMYILYRISLKFATVFYQIRVKNRGFILFEGRLTHELA